MTTDNYYDNISDFDGIEPVAKENINAEIFITLNAIEDFVMKMNNCDDELKRNFYKTYINEWINDLKKLMKHQ